MSNVITRSEPRADLPRFGPKFSGGLTSVHSVSTKQTQSLASQLAKKILAREPRAGALVLALTGDLGSGKTTFIQGLAKGLGIRARIASPTFVIMRKFQIPRNKKRTNSKFQISKFKTFKKFYHFDCYRLQKPEEILELGWREILADPKNIMAIEWPERIKKFLPKETNHLNFKFIDKNQREIRIGKTAIFMVK